MSANPLIAALQESYGGPPDVDDPNTVRGLLSYCRRWLKGEVSSEELSNPCLQMAGRLQGAAASTFRDLDQNPDLCDEAKEPVLTMGESFEAIAEILMELPTLATKNRRDEFEDALDEFEAERLAVLDANEEIHAQMSGRERRCPKCGQGGEGERCEQCDLLLLYPDPGQLRDYSHKSAQLSALHRQVYQAYLEVLKGERSLETLLRVLPGLASHLEEMLLRCNKLGPQTQIPAALPRHLEAGLAGIERMRGAAQSYRTSDLNRGWEDLFESSASLRRELSYLSSAKGEHAEGLPRSSDGLDFGRPY